MRKVYPLMHRFNQSQTLNFCTFRSPFLHSLHQFSQRFEVHLKRRQLTNLLRSITKQNPIPHCIQIHAQVILSGFESNCFITNLLLTAYAKSDILSNARQLFDKMSKKDLLSWSSMVSMYSRHGLNVEAFLTFLNFRRCSYKSPNEYILASAMCACAQLINNGDVDVGNIAKQMHSFILKTGFDQNVCLGTYLVDLHTKNGDIDEARMVFEGLSEKSAFTWTTMIKGYVHSGRSVVSLQMFYQMRETDVVPDRYVLSSVLSACSTLEFVEGGKEIHGHVIRKRIEMDVSFVNVLIDFYVKCGKVETARKVFDGMVDTNVISWTAMIAGYMQNSFDTEAIKLFIEMTRLGRDLDGFVCASILSSCSSLEALELGRQVHAYGIKANVEQDLFVKNGLISMYTKCDCLNDARIVFDCMANHNVVSYNALIEGCSRSEQIHEAVDLFHKMRHRMLQPSLLTFVSLLGASSAVSSLELSKQIHALIIRFGFASKLFAGSALIDVYSKFSCLIDARLVFDEMNQKDIVVWNAMFSGYTQQSENEAAFKLYSELQISEQKPNGFTFAALITAASNLASLQHGQQFHCQMIKMGLGFDPFVVNSLVDMYAKSGSFGSACEAFGSSTRRDVVCWNSMISTYAHHGEAKEALQKFEEMMDEGIEPNYVTFIGLLSACNHAGLVEEGLGCFKSMHKFGIEPGTEHYVCVVSLLGRARKLYEAKEFIEKMPVKPAAVVWRSLLSECRHSGDFELGKYAAEMAISIDVRDSSSYTLLSNIYASKGMWEDVKQVRKRMDVVGVVKEVGHSWIELRNETGVFIARDRSHCHTLVIYSVLHNLIMQIRETCHVLDTTTTLLVND
ncbi:pentatricopeptide repeat-containing protein At4g39530 [Euphorbia lathyris]|uniref:pentatricopeptide repeat-containing protein At4g39530 n=1 Tax=Euphorbia lathyris TaxID=212925 RepID=UPI003313CFFD